MREAYGIYVPRIGREPAPMGFDYETLVASGAVWVAEELGALVGVLVLEPQPDALLIENVAVVPALQRRGIGRALLGFAERHALELGLPKVRLYTNELMTENLALYPALGYVETGRRGEHGFRRVFFEKSVGPE